MQRSRPFLALCQDVVTDLGVTGGVIQSVIGNTSIELQRIVNWVARADVLIQSVWSDWNFLWFKDAITIAAGVDTFGVTYAFDDVDHLSLALNPDTTGTQTTYPNWMDWEYFAITWQNKPKTAVASPTNWSMDPSGTIWLSHYMLTSTPCFVAYWRVPVRMAANTDTSPIPAKFDSIIVERAKILYAERENAIEIMSGSSAEYTDTLDKLQSSCLPSGRAARKSRNDRTTNNDGFVE